MRNKWTKDLLTDLYIIQNLSMKEIAIKYGVDSSTISKTISRLGIEKAKKSSTRARKLDLTKSNLEKMYLEDNLSTSQIGKLYGVTASCVSYRLKDFDITKPRQQVSQSRSETRKGKGRNTSVDLSILDRANPSFCWLAGWAATDGHLYTKTLRIALNNKDTDVLQKIAKLVGLPQNRVRPIKDNKVELNISSTTLVEYMTSTMGLSVGNKTFSIRVPELVSEDCSKLYVRGAFEGDGSVFENKGYCCFKLVSASKDYLPGIIKEIHKYTSVKLKIYSDAQKSGNPLYAVKVSGKKAITVLDWLYSGYPNLMMDRKYNKYVSLKGM